VARLAFERLRVHRLSEDVADTLLELVLAWPALGRDKVGKQLVRAADSIGANISEGYGRGTPVDNRRFVRVARGSLNETIQFRRRAHRRKLVTAEATSTIKGLMDELGPKLNAYLGSIVPTRNPPPTTNHRQK
jgi:four helix bundle protein